MPSRKEPLIKYEIDPHNRLVSCESAKDSGVQFFRQVLDGKFVIDKNNNLSYHIKKSNHKNIPQQIKLRGDFSLNKLHHLVFTLDKWNNQVFQDKLVLKAAIIDAKNNELSFSLITKDDSEKTLFYILKVKGCWNADEQNRLCFNIAKSNGQVDTLVFEGIWQVDNNNELIYSYFESNTKRKKKKKQTITFKGYWDITKANRLIYQLAKDNGSSFDFKVKLARFSQAQLLFSVEVGAQAVKRIISLSGGWKLDKNLGLIFEMCYADKRIKSIGFQAMCKLQNENTLSFRLYNSRGEDLALEVKLSRDIFEGTGEVYLKTLTGAGNNGIYLGTGFKW